MKTVDKKMLDACVHAYGQHQMAEMESPTTSISFDSKKLAEWLNKVAPHCDHIKMRFGIYTPEHAPHKSLAGRTTAFLCPCKEDGDPATDENGDEIPPTNHGSLHP